MALTHVAILTAYCINAYQMFKDGLATEAHLKAWAVTILVFVGIEVVATIIIQIIFHILYSIGVAVKEREHSGVEIEKSIESSMVEDEMDKLIALKSSQVAFVFAGIGFAYALILVLLGYSSAIMVNVIFIAFGLGSIAEGILSLYYYRKGVTHA